LRLWDNRPKPKKQHYFVAVCIVVVLIGSVGVFLVLFAPKTTSQTIVASVLPPVKLSARTVAPPMRATTELLPKADNPSGFFMQQLEAMLAPKPIDCAVEACVALSFDDGPDPVSTPVILHALAKEHIKATFFLVGVRVASGAGLVRRMHAEGHDIGNHSWVHANFTRLTPLQIQQQIDQTQTVITSVGVPMPIMFRPPYGAINLAILSRVNMPIIMWNVDPKDWKENDPAKIAEAVEIQAKPGAIIILHDKAATAAAVERIVQNLKSRFHLVTVTEMLHITPDMRGVFRGR